MRNRPEWIPAFAGMTGVFSQNIRRVSIPMYRRISESPAEIPAFAGMECTFPPVVLPGMENFIFGGNSRVHLVIPANAGIHFYRQIPAFTSFFTKKMCRNSQT